MLFDMPSPHLFYSGYLEIGLSLRIKSLGVKGVGRRSLLKWSAPTVHVMLLDCWFKVLICLYALSDTFFISQKNKYKLT